MLDYKTGEENPVSFDNNPQTIPERDRYFEIFIKSDKFDEYSNAFNYLFPQIRTCQMDDMPNSKFVTPIFLTALIDKYFNTQHFHIISQRDNPLMDVSPTIKLLQRAILKFSKAQLFDIEHQNRLLEIAKTELSQLNNIEANEFYIKVLTALASYRTDLRDQLIAENYLFSFCNDGTDHFDFTFYNTNLTLYSKFYISLVQGNSNSLPAIYFDFCHFLLDQFDSKSCQTDYDEYYTPRLPLLKSLRALLESSFQNGKEVLQRDFICFLIEKVHCVEFPIFMSKLIKEEILIILEIFTFLIENNNSQYLLDKGLIRWLIDLSVHNQLFECRTQNRLKATKIFREFVNCICKLVLSNQNCFTEDTLIQRVFDIIKTVSSDCKFDYKPHVFRLCYTFFSCSPSQVFEQMIVNDFHVVFLEDIKIGLHFENEIEPILRTIMRFLEYFEPYQIAQLIDEDELIGFFNDSNYDGNAGLMINSIIEKVKGIFTSE